MSTPTLDFALTLAIADPYDFVACQVKEGISQTTHAIVELASTEDLDLSRVLGAQGTLQAYVDGAVRRQWTLAVGKVGFAAAKSDTLRYRVDLFSPMWLLRFTKNTRKFQKKSAQEIIATVLGECGIAHAFELSRETARRNYCVQYRETNFDFVSRLLEEEGIYHCLSPDGVTLFADASPGAADVDGRATIEDVEAAGALERADFGLHTIWRGRRIQSGKATVNDWNWKTPDVDLISSATGDAEPDLEIYDYPSGYRKPAQGAPIAQRRVEALRAGATYLAGTGDQVGFEPARVFRFGDGAGGGFAGEYLLTRVDHVACSPAFNTGGDGPALDIGADLEGQVIYRNSFHAIPKSVPYRPPLATPRPRIAGNHTVMVRGPEGSEIHTDKRGRFKAQFHWDREAVGTDEDSRWVRVLQESGSSSFLARVGWEMTVAYIEGDPDRPVGLARDINGEMVPAYAQPTNKNVMTIKTPSSPATGGYNEIKLDDSAGSMSFNVRAERDFNLLVKNDRTEKVAINETHTVDDNFTHTVERNQSLSVGANKTDDAGAGHNLQVDGDRTVNIGGNEKVKVDGSASVGVEGNDSESVGSLRLTLAGGIAPPDLLARARGLAPTADGVKGGLKGALEGGVSAGLGAGSVTAGMSSAKAGLKGMVPTPGGMAGQLTGGLSNGLSFGSVAANLLVGGIDRYGQARLMRMVGGAFITASIGNINTSMAYGYLEAVGGAKLTVTADGSIMDSTGGPHLLTVGGVIMRKSGEDMGYAAKSSNVNVGGLALLRSSEKLTIKSDGEIQIKAATGLTFKNAGLEIKLSPSKITMKGDVAIETEEKIEISGGPDKITDSSSDTTGNQDVVIATDGTTHVAATQGATDQCFLADKKTVVPFPNEIETKGNVVDGTTNTFVGDDSILTESSQIGPTSSGDEQGEGKGVSSTTVADIAEPSSWSRDVKTEGSYVVRTDDKTTQNDGQYDRHRTGRHARGRRRCRRAVGQRQVQDRQNHRSVPARPSVAITAGPSRRRAQLLGDHRQRHRRAHRDAGRRDDRRHARLRQAR